WLHRVTVNAVLAHRRKKASRPEFLLSTPLDNFPSNGREAARKQQAPNPDSRILDREAQHLIERAIASLPTIYRDVLVLSDVEQFTNPEIADLLGLSLPAVK